MFHFRANQHDLLNTSRLFQQTGMNLNLFHKPSVEMTVWISCKHPSECDVTVGLVSVLVLIDMMVPKLKLKLYSRGTLRRLVPCLMFLWTLQIFTSSRGQAHTVLMASAPTGFEICFIRDFIVFEYLTSNCHNEYCNLPQPFPLVRNNDLTKTRSPKIKSSAFSH